MPEEFLARVPANVSWAEAGTVPGVGATAYEAFAVHAPLSPGMQVLVNGAAGGVGTYAVQVARAMGAEVTGTCSGSKLTLVRDLGAARVIDYTTADPFDPAQGRYEVVLNAVRGARLSRLRDLLRPRGVLVTVAGGSESARGDRESRRIVSFFVQTSGELLAGLARMIEQGQVRPVVEGVYSWEHLAGGGLRSETGRVAGKLAVAPALPLSQDLEAPPSIPGWPLYLRRRREGGGRRDTRASPAPAPTSNPGSVPASRRSNSYAAPLA